MDYVSRVTALRRYEAAGWLRKTVGVVGGKDLPAEPSEEDFRIGLRSGIILCNVLNKIQPGAVSKVLLYYIYTCLFFGLMLSCLLKYLLSFDIYWTYAVTC